MICNRDFAAPSSRTRVVLTLAASLLGAACQSDSVLAPPTGGAESVRLSASSGQLTSLGDTLRLDALVRGASGQQLSATPVRWQLSVPGVLEQVGNGQFRAVGNGRVTISAFLDPSGTGVRPRGYFADAMSDSVTVHVQQAPAQVYALSADTLYNMIGITRAVRLRITDARGHDIDRDALRVVYEMMNAQVAAVDSTGTLRSVSEGRTELVATISTSSGAATWRSPVSVRPRAAHTSCMTFTQRRQARQACVTSDFVVHAPRAVTP